ncbi:Glyoxysomal processing protease, glyoxysomal [Thalictrum thalictroides]|uniref:Glyoxysomal processing protease, glyoxysomal n=1 Tax=Thalictrum thalictroides TaxID=46969 RepID=A0A7J6V461_THATH|nr:Glyoxysomal processing protease, glyoxysomal [Thalictrum thalictroides]
MMELPEVVEFARNFSVMVRTQGPDPKGVKMQKHVFHHYNSGKTTLSASGMLLPGTYSGPLIGDHLSVSALVVTVASVVEPFLLPQHRANTSQHVLPELIPGAQIDVMVEGKMLQGTNLNKAVEGNPQWISSKLIAVVDVPASSLALQSLIEAPGGSWEVGWSLALLNNNSQNFTHGLQTQVKLDIRSQLENRSHSGWNDLSKPSAMAMSPIRIAFLGVPSVTTEGITNINTSLSNKRGDCLLAVGSPFGVLSPDHFFNSICVGSISNFCPSRSYNCSLLMADIRCLPGMEGGPVFNEHAHLVGILNRPLRQRAGGAEIQLVIPWEAIALAQSDLLQNDAIKMGLTCNKGNIHAMRKACSSESPESRKTFNFVSKNQDSHHLSALQIEKAMASIALVTVDDEAWASGIVLNNNGLILTNAHLLEPWRFDKTNVQGGDVMSSAFPVTFKELVSKWHEGSEVQKKRKSLFPNILSNLDVSLRDEVGGDNFGLLYKSNKRIRVRLDHRNPCIWSNAMVVYISKGPLDIALLQLTSLPNDVSPIIPDFSCPSPGSKVHVIGHGLFGPRSDLRPSVCSGVVSRVVKAQRHFRPLEPGSNESTMAYLPAMLETTAAVHAGGSGGAIVNSEGHMVGLVTSNAKYGGGTIVPHLNFSIPCKALESIFKFSEEMQDLSILQELDQPSEHLSSVWALMPPLSSRQDRPFIHQPDSLSKESNKEEKGSRFAKFIAERNGEVFLGPKQLIKAGKSSNKFLLSKL